MQQNRHVLAYLQNAAENSSLSHAYALIGPSASNRMDLLEDFLVAFVPAESLNHPDISVIEPEDEVITIGVMRRTREWLSMTPIAADKKVLIIKHAHAMNHEAQNAFLKILEEPAQHTYIFLLLGHKEQVLATVYSRVIPLYVATGPTKTEETDAGHLIHELLSARDAPRRMRLWLAAGIAKEEIRSWISDALPELRNQLRGQKSRTLAQAIRELLDMLAHPKGANWQLAAERLIISL